MGKERYGSDDRADGEQTVRNSMGRGLLGRSDKDAVTVDLHIAGNRELCWGIPVAGPDFLSQLLKKITEFSKFSKCWRGFCSHPSPHRMKGWLLLSPSLKIPCGHVAILTFFKLRLYFSSLRFFKT